MNTRKKISAIIFDCDGVLFDSRQANINFYNHLLNHFGLPKMTKERIDFIHMHTADGSIRFLFEGTPYVEQALAYRSEMDYTPFLEDMVPEAGLEALLDKLKGRFKLAVATNRSDTIGAVLKRHGLEAYFQSVISSLDVAHPKPHPEALYKILDLFGIDADQAYYVGDSLVDAQTAQAANVPFIAYKNSGLEADHHVDRLMDIADRILKIS
jgi:HAD superfamily hydrolase (TIGR01509 family)